MPVLHPAEPFADIGMLGMLNAVLRNRRVILALALLCSVISVATGFVTARTWSASATLLAEARHAAGGLSGIAAQLGVNVPDADAGQSPGFYTDLAKSRVILGALADSTFEVDGRRAPLRDHLAPGVFDPRMRREKAIGLLAKMVQSSWVQKTGVVQISAEASSPAMAQRIVERILVELNHFDSQRRRSQARAEREFTQQRLAEVQAALRVSEERLLRSRQGNRIYGAASEAALEYDRLTREVSERQQVFSTLQQAFERSKIEEVREQPVFTIIDQPEAPLLPNPRGTVHRAVLGVVLGVILGVLITLFRDFLRVSRRAPSEEHAEFSRVWTDTVRDIASPLRVFRSRSR